MKTRVLRRLAATLAAAVTVMALPCTALADSVTETGWQSTPNGYSYLLEDGTAAIGETDIDGIPYLFAPNGILQLGWQTVGDLRYYYSPATRTPHFGWLDWRGGTYYITEEAGKAVGFVQTDRGLCYFDAYGVLHHGWLYDDAQNRRYYTDKYGVIVTGDATIDGLPYLFDENGVQQLGWQEIDGKRYYFNADGSGEYQWLTLDGEKYYLTVTDGMLTGEQNINGMPYVFAADGRQLLGWYTYSDGSVTYFDADGDAVSGLQSIDGTLYYFSDDYRMQTGFQSIADAVYYFGTDGSLQTGFINHEGNRYYSNAEGILQSGWVTVDHQRYYCDENGMLLTGWQSIDDMSCYFTPMGILSTGWQIIDGMTYYFGEDGAMTVGWCNIDVTKYYFTEDGAMAIGWCEIDGTKYYFTEDGAMAIGWCDIDGTKYYFTEDGTFAVGWQSIDGTSYFFAADGAMTTGWQLLDGSYYYFGTDGAMAVSSTVEGYIIDENGVAATPLRTQVAALLDASGTAADSIYAYTSSHYRYRRIEETRTFAQLEAAGWDTLVEYTLANGRGVCYYLAATTDYFLQLAGYKTRIVYANHSTGDHYWCQVWNGTAWRNYDPTFTDRCNLSLNEIIELGNYTIYGYAEITYNERGDYMGITYNAVS